MGKNWPKITKVGNTAKIGLDLDFSVASAYGDVAAEQLLNQALFMPIGFIMVSVYVTIMLGHLTCVENRVREVARVNVGIFCVTYALFFQALLSGVGMSIIGLTILVTYGLCSAFGLFYGPMHNAIPFLFLGIGTVSQI